MGSTLVELFRYHRWGNLRLIDACADLGDEALAASAEGTFGDIRATLTHIVEMEEGYLVPLDGEPPAGGELGPLAALRARAERSGDRLVAVAERSGEDEVLRGEWSGRPFAIPRSIFLSQALVHGAEHRAQVATILGQRGIEPPIIDAWTFAAGAGAAAGRD